jgi:hypothetical protein
VPAVRRLIDILCEELLSENDEIYQRLPLPPLQRT